MIFPDGQRQAAFALVHSFNSFRRLVFLPSSMRWPIRIADEVSARIVRGRRRAVATLRHASCLRDMSWTSSALASTLERLEGHPLYFHRLSALGIAVSPRFCLCQSPYYAKPTSRQAFSPLTDHDWLGLRHSVKLSWPSHPPLARRQLASELLQTEIAQPPQLSPEAELSQSS